MFRSICGGFALAVCSLSVLSGAPRPHGDQPTPPMQFSLHRKGPANVCGSNCGLLISASGIITADTPRDFNSFVRRHDVRGQHVRGATIVFDSKGGSVLGAIALGRAIRGFGLTTTVGRVREQKARDGTVKRSWIWPRAECQSMCPFVLLGGIRRYIPPEARVLVHQIWFGYWRDEAASASYSAEDLMLVQHDIGQLVQYTLDMGAGGELLKLAMRIPPWEPLHVLSRDELRGARLDTRHDRAGAGAEPVSEATRNEIYPRASMMAEGGGAAAPVRRHPLTIEDGNIGLCEVAPHTHAAMRTRSSNPKGLSELPSGAQVSADGT